MSAVDDIEDYAHREAVARGYIGARVRCNACEAVIYSTHRHDMHPCECRPGASTRVWVDGGGAYLRLMWDTDASFEVIDEDA